MQKIFFYLTCMLPGVSMLSAHIPFNMRYHIRDIFYMVDSVISYTPRHTGIIDMEYREMIEIPLGYKDTLEAEAQLLQKNIYKSPRDASLRMALSRLYVHMGLYDPAINILAENVEFSHAAVLLSQIALAQGNVPAFKWYYNVMDTRWAEKNYPSLYIELKAWYLYHAGAGRDSAVLFLEMEKNANGEKKIYAAWSAVRAYLSYGDKRTAWYHLKRIITIYKSHASEMRLCAGDCFDPCDDSLQEYIDVISPSYEGVYRKRAMITIADVFIKAKKYNEAEDIYKELEKEIDEKDAMYISYIRGRAYIYKMTKDEIDEKQMYKILLLHIDDKAKDYWEVRKRYAQLCVAHAKKPVIDRQMYRTIYELYDAGKILEAEHQIENIFSRDICSKYFMPRYELLLALCRGRLYGKGAMVRSLRKIHDVYHDTRQGEFAQKALEVYDNR